MISNKTIAVIGAGLIGSAWAVVFARNGWSVRLYDPEPSAMDAVMANIEVQAGALQEAGLGISFDQLAGNIELIGDLGDALAGVGYVQECGPEILDVKRSIFAELDRLAPSDAILASSTSGFMASSFTDHIASRNRALVAHPVNPPHLVPLVEVAPAQWTDQQVVRKTRDIMESVGQVPIMVRKEIQGFILNRLQGALLNEAVRLAEGGYASPEDIDKTVRDGLGLRWSFIGPFETIDLNAPGGLRDYAERYSKLYLEMAREQAEPPNWGESVVSELEQARRERLAQGDLKERQNWRDRRLAALIAHKQQQTDK